MKPTIFLFEIENVCVCKTLDDRKFLIPPPVRMVRVVMYQFYVEEDVRVSCIFIILVT